MYYNTARTITFVICIDAYRITLTGRDFEEHDAPRAVAGYFAGGSGARR